MKTKLTITCSIVLLSFVWLSSCKKESSISAINAAATSGNFQADNNKQCRLTHLVRGPYGTWDFYYNEQGIADKWKVDFGDGTVENWKITHDASGKITHAKAYDDFDNLIYTTSFSYDGEQIKKQRWYDVANDYTIYIRYTHNEKGQISSIYYSDGNKVIFSYDDMGNNIRADYYYYGSIYFSDIYEFNENVNDPLLSVKGIDFPFPYYASIYFDKQWFSRNLSIGYDYDGTQYVYNDFSAAKKDFTLGSGLMPISINYFDTVSQSIFNYSFGYSCSGNALENSIPQSSSSIGKNKPAISPGHTLLSRGKSLKEQLLEMRKHIKDYKKLDQ